MINLDGSRSVKEIEFGRSTFLFVTTPKDSCVILVSRNSPEIP